MQGSFNSISGHLMANSHTKSCRETEPRPQKSPQPREGLLGDDQPPHPAVTSPARALPHRTRRPA